MTGVLSILLGRGLAIVALSALLHAPVAHAQQPERKGGWADEVKRSLDKPNDRPNETPGLGLHGGGGAGPPKPDQRQGQPKPPKP